MGTVSKSYASGDTVWVAYPITEGSVYWTPQQRTVKDIKVTGTGNTATVTFTNGAKVEDSDATQTVYTTQALCAAAIVTDIIAKSAATVVLDATTSAASTSGQTSSTLGRIG